MRGTRRGGVAMAMPLILALVFVGIAVVAIIEQEPPRGTLTGKVVAEELGRPLPGVKVYLSAKFTVGGERPETRIIRAGPDGRFAADWLDAGEWAIRASARAHELGPVGVEVEEGRTRDITLELAPVEPFLHLIVHQHMFTSDEPVQIACRGFVEPDVIRVHRYLVDFDRLIATRGGNLHALGIRSDTSIYELERNSALTDAGSVALEIRERDSEGLFYQRGTLGEVPPGLYVIAAETAGLAELDWVMVTDLGLIAKHDDERLYTYVTDLASGEAVTDVEVTVYQDGQALASAAPSAEGLSSVSLAEAESGWRTVVARAGDSFTYLQEYMSSYRADREPRCFIYTERPVYRPGHEVNFKGVVRSLVGEEYQVPAGREVRVEVRDQNDRLTYTSSLQSDEFGCFYDSLQLSDAAPTGYYGLQARMDRETFYGGFEVVAYRKPEFEIKLTPGKKRYTRGEEAHVKAEGLYYFGAPVADCEVTYTVRRSQYWFCPEYEEYYDWAGESWWGAESGTIVADGYARTDAAGEVDIVFDTAVEEESEIDTDHLYTVEVELTDPSRRSVSETANVLVTRGEFYLQVRPEPSVSRPGQAVQVAITAMDYEGKPKAGINIQVETGYAEWTEGTERFERDVAKRVTTNEAGEASLEVTPGESGIYDVRAETRDERGNRIADRATCWVSEGDYADMPYDYGELELVTDKEVYEPGESAQVLINTDREGIRALLSIEGGRLYECRTVELAGKTTRLSVPILRKHIPNIFISVCYVSNKKFVQREAAIKVSPRQRVVEIALEPDRETYHPGEAAAYAIRTTDEQGRPVRAQVSLGVVDEAIYAIREEPSEGLLETFYPKQYNAVETSFSWPRIYLDPADKGGARLKVRREFPDTALWMPAIVTDASGEATVNFSMPDTLTTWRATARAVTLDTRVGKATDKVVCTKDLLLRVQTPRFLVEGDRFTLSMVAHNRTDQPRRITVEPRCQGIDWEEWGPIAALPGGEARRFDWAASAMHVGPATVQGRLETRGGVWLGDAMEVTLPVLPRGRARVEQRSGAALTDEVLKLNLREDAIEGATSLKVGISPSIAAALLRSAQYLAGYPWGCIEQTMSSWLPDVVLYDSFKDLGLDEADLPEDLGEMVEKGLLRIYDKQVPDGGWGWCRYDDSDPWMTAYVMFGLAVARRAGWEVDRRAFDEGLRALGKHIAASKTNAEDVAFGMYAAALADRQDLVEQAAHRLRRKHLSDYALACKTLALGVSVMGGDDLWRRVKETDAFCWWGSGYKSYETTALCLKAALAINPKDRRIYKVVRWLMHERRGDHWLSTRDTAMVLYALVDFVRLTGEMAPDFIAVVRLNDEQLARKHMTRADVFAPEMVIEVAAEKLRAGANKLVITREVTGAGRGNLYYSVDFRQTLREEHFAEVVSAANISVGREYYKVVTRTDPKLGTLRPMPSKTPRDSFKSGDSVLVKLTITAGKAAEHVIIEEPLPAGFEVAERGGLDRWSWRNWWSDTDVRDERIGFFARTLPAGERVIKYHLRATIPGTFCALPTHLYCMYDPETRASGAESTLKITD